ncbi:hypothetical protein J1N35_000615, partial [Gossypium stocksii]
YRASKKANRGLEQMLKTKYGCPSFIKMENNLNIPERFRGKQHLGYGMDEKMDARDGPSQTRVRKAK